MPDLPRDNNYVPLGLVYRSITSGRQVVTSAGTRVPLVSTPTACKRVDVMAETNNTNYIVVGGSGVIALEATRKGIPLSGGMSFTFYIRELSDIYVDALENGEGVTFVFFD